MARFPAPPPARAVARRQFAAAAALNVQAYARTLARDAALCARFAGRSTVTARDVRLAQRLRRRRTSSKTDV